MILINSSDIFFFTVVGQEISQDMWWKKDIFSVIKSENVVEERYIKVINGSSKASFLSTRQIGRKICH